MGEGTNRGHPRIHGLQNSRHLISELHARKSPYRLVRRSFSEDVHPCGVASAKTYTPAALYHFIVKGIDRRDIFNDIFLAGRFRKSADSICNS